MAMEFKGEKAALKKRRGLWIKTCFACFLQFKGAPRRVQKVLRSDVLFAYFLMSLVLLSGLYKNQLLWSLSTVDDISLCESSNFFWEMAVFL